jgi:hypothetical protein
MVMLNERLMQKQVAKLMEWVMQEDVVDESEGEEGSVDYQRGRGR